MARRHIPLLALLALTAQGVICQTLCSDPECETCRGTTCVRCKEGLFIDDKGFCSPCLTLNCAACANATTCTACKPADFAASSGSNQAPLLYLDRKTGTCKPCPGLFDPYRGPCAQCGSNGKCSRCNEGHYLDASKTCKPCADPLCKQCTATRCLRCYDSWYEPESEGEYPNYAVYMDKSGTCQKCTRNNYDSGCTACDANGRCTKCGNHYGGTSLDKASGKCVKCKDRLCSLCSTSTPSVCITCQTKPFWYWDSADYGPVYKDAKTGKCTECENRVDQGCKRCNNRGACVECDNTGFLNKGKCTPCSARFDRCSKCHKEGKFCTECDSGYGLQAGRCIKCPEGTKQCKNGKPTACNDGWYLSKSGTCKEKPKGCDQVLADGTCHSCLNGYRPVAGGKCQKCFESGCVRCIMSDGFSCPKCDAARQWCTDCSGGYFGLTKDCKKCKDPVCESCEEDAAKCQSCGSFSLTRGAYLDAQGRCSPCPQGCSSCDESGACSQCAPGYGFKGKVCVRCTGKYCTYCSQDANICQSCHSDDFPTYLTSKGVCEKAKTRGCADFAGDGKCLQCEYGWTLRNGICVV